VKLLRIYLRRNWRSLFILLALTIDIIALVCSGLGAYFLRNYIPNVPAVGVWALTAFGVIYSAIFLFFGLLLGLYRGAFHIESRRQSFLAAKTYSYGTLAILSASYLLQLVVMPRRFTILFILLLPLLYSAGRYFLSKFSKRMQRRGLGVRKAVIFFGNGLNKDWNKREELLEALGYQVSDVVVLEDSGAHSVEHARKEDLNVISVSALPSLIRDRQIEVVFIPSVQFVLNGAKELVRICRDLRVKLQILSPETESLLRISRLYDVAGITVYAPPRWRVEKVRALFKRSFDIVAALLLLLLLSPIFSLTAAAIFLESGHPVIFKQRRSLTKGGKGFFFYKFRSLIHEADNLKDSIFHLNESNGALFKMKRDPRLTVVGRFLRRFSVDEFPQLFNVLKGDMSLVGPRPLPERDFEGVNEGPDFWEAVSGRELAKPGMTGLWQISGRSILGFREMVLLDLYYIENQSVMFDLEILFATLPVVLFGKGAY
jgi:exopolysaccharide biosynthesis polyprenyl glycosylphosphotransferase